MDHNLNNGLSREERLENLREYYKNKDPLLRKTMSVPEMRRLLGMKKTGSYWLIHQDFFKTIMVNGHMRVDIESFEKWYANQLQHRKVSGEEPGLELRSHAFTMKDGANYLGIYVKDFIRLCEDNHFHIYTVEYWNMVEKEEVDQWLSTQSIYHNASHGMNAEQVERECIALSKVAKMFGINNDKMLRIATAEYSDVLESFVYDEHRWITKKSLELFLKSQDKYRCDSSKSEDNYVDQVDTSKLKNVEAAAMAGVSPATITRWAQDGKVASTGMGRSLRIDKESLIKYLEYSGKVES